MNKQVSHSYKPRPKGSLKEAVTALIGAVGGVKAAAELIGKKQAQTHRYGDDAYPESQIPVHQVRTLETAAREPIVASFLANEQGYIIIPLNAEDGGSLNIDFAKFGEESANFFAAYALAQADGVFDEFEHRELLSRVAKINQVTGAIYARLRAGIEKLEAG